MQRSLAGLLVLSTLLLACGPSRQETLYAWMRAQGKADMPSIRQIPEPQAFKHLPYAQGGRKDPFTKQHLVALADAQTEKANPDLSLAQKSRPRQPLEKIALESMAFVGVLETQGRCVGLVRADGIVYQVAPGQYIGKNFGQVWRVDEAGIMLREIAQDAAGRWFERDTYLRIHGSKQ